MSDKQTSKTYEIGRRIAARREALSLTQEDVAKLIKKTVSAIKQIEAGESTKQFVQLSCLAEALATTPNQILGFDPPPSTEDDLDVMAATIEGLLMESGWSEDRAERLTALALRATRERAIAGVDRRLAALTLAVHWLRDDQHNGSR